jgi:hypothetical protein
MLLPAAASKAIIRRWGNGVKSAKGLSAMTQNSSSGQLPEPLPELARLAGILLFVQALLRLAFLLLPLLSYGLRFVNVFTYITVLMAVAGIAVGTLTLQRYALARLLGIIFCVIGLLLQLYSVINIVNGGYASRLPVTTWILIPAYLAIYVFALYVFLTLPYYKSDAATAS